MATHSPRQKGRQLHKKKICEICGDIGFLKALITCNQCKDVDVHQYCVVGYLENAPNDWCCEECVRKRENKYSKGSKLHASANISQSILPPKKRTKFPGGHGINWEKEVQTGKTKYLPVEEAIGLLNTAFSKVVSMKSMDTKKRTVQYSLGSTGYSKPHNVSYFRTTEPSKKQVQSSKGPGCSTILELRTPDAVKASGMMNPLMTHLCDPAQLHSWKGSFDILGAPKFALGMLNNCIQAHPSSRVRRKVYEFLGLLPHTLKFELVSRGEIWKNLFNNHCPGKEDIGMYFFASERERSEIYTDLVEFIRTKDLVMKTLINDVELLIFASTTLCSDSQKWNNEHFLWGLFYRVGQDTDGCVEGGSNKVIDMKIDMIAGENVGTLDVVVSKTTFRNGFDLSL